jgi:hypothetical protein
MIFYLIGKIMTGFKDKYNNQIYGILHGFDRLIIKGYIGHFFYNNNFYYFLNKECVQLKDFKDYALKNNKLIKEHVDGIITSSGCYKEYLRSPNISKEEIAKRIQKEDGIKEGVICVLSCVEPCTSLSIGYNSISKKLEKTKQFRKCLHYYLYYEDKDFGFMHVRFQTWFPFGIQIYINGKEYLKKQLEKEKIGYHSYDNSLTWVSDLERAQQISDRFHEKKWDKVFDHFAERINKYLPRIKEIFNGNGYKWMIEQCEYASDVLFKDVNELQKYFPYFIEYASLCQMGSNIYTFFGRKLHGHCQGETVSDRKYFWNQGFRIKFTLDKNSLKMYDKTSVLRVETTINNSNAFKIRNPNKSAKKKWVPMGKAISNMYRYAEVAKACNLRYLNSLTSVDRDNTLDKRIEKLCNNVEVKLSMKSDAKPRLYSGFNLLNEFSCAVFNAVLNGAFQIRGFSNKNLRSILLEQKVLSIGPEMNMKKLSGKITRLIAKLRAHKLVSKLPNTRRYRVTKIGEEIMARILLFKKLDLKFC